MNEFYLQLKSISKYTTPFAVVMAVICIWLSAQYNSGQGFHIIAFGITAGWLSIPLLCWFLYMPKENPLSFITSIYPSFLKSFTLTGVIALLLAFTIFTVASYFNAV